MYLDFDKVKVGDYVECQVINKKNDHNLDGMKLRGKIIEKNSQHRQIKLESGWCCHETDLLLEHRPSHQL